MLQIKKYTVPANKNKHLLKFKIIIMIKRNKDVSENPSVQYM